MNPMNPINPTNPMNPSPSGELKERLDQTLEQLKQTQIENERLQGRLQEIERERALDEKKALVLSAIEALNPKDAPLILRLIDFEQVKIGENSALEGLNEQLAPLLRSAPYLFLEAVDPAGGSPESGDYEEEFDMNTFLRGER